MQSGYINTAHKTAQLKYALHCALHAHRYTQTVADKSKVTLAHKGQILPHRPLIRVMCERVTLDRTTTRILDTRPKKASLSHHQWINMPVASPSVPD